MEDSKRITDENGINYLIEKPKQGQNCQIKIKGEEGYNSCVQYINGHFETCEEFSNRVTITRWKADLWLPVAYSSILNKLKNKQL